MIGIYINFNSNEDLELIESELQSLAGFEVGGHSEYQPVWLLCEYSVDGEISDFTEEECNDIRMSAEKLLNENLIEYTITVSS